MVRAAAVSGPSGSRPLRGLGAELTGQSPLLGALNLSIAIVGVDVVPGDVLMIAEGCSSSGRVRPHTTLT